jgi:hypothetical protein
MQGLGLSDPKERRRYSNSLNGNVVLHSPHPGRRKLICDQQAAAHMKSLAFATIALIGAGFFATAMVAFTASRRRGPPTVAVLGLVRRRPKRPHCGARDIANDATAKTRPNPQPKQPRLR